MTLFNTVHIRRNLERPDFVQLPNGDLSLAAAMFLAHELTHVWQWQNRDVTGYSPLRVSAEHMPGEDPYLFDPGSNPRFTDFAYEQQASMVEEYVCCVSLDPEGARTERLHALLSQVMDPGDLPEARVRVPWPDVETRGICSA